MSRVDFDRRRFGLRGRLVRYRTSVDKRSRRTALLAVILAGQLVACGGGAPGEVPARANIFGAGRDAPPAPAGGGAGVLPPVWQLSAGTERLIAFSRVEGQVNPIEGEAGFVGPAGDGGRFGTTDVKSYEGISGIVHRRNGMFLVGVFLTDAAPSGTAPARLDFTDREEFDLLTGIIDRLIECGSRAVALQTYLLSGREAK